MNQDTKLLGYYNYTVALTYVGMSVGFFGILCAIDGYFFRCVVCLMIAGICDMFDGAIASTMERTVPEKSFGVQIDSLSDLICFGVLPAVLIYCSNARHVHVTAIAVLYVLCALIRLAYFNVDEQERQKDSEESRKIYFGLPVTLSAVFIPTIYCIGTLFNVKTNTALLVALLAMAILFLVPIRLKKPGTAGKVCVMLLGVVEIILIVIAWGKM